MLFRSTKFKIVVGYPGGNDVNLAMERGEVAGRNNTWSSWKSTRSDWLKNKDIYVIAYGGPTPSDIGDVPNIESLAKSEEDKQVMRLVLSGTHFGRPMVAPPGVPADRVAAMRKAFMEMAKDPAFLKEAETMKIDVDPQRGEDMHKIIQEIMAYPESVKKQIGRAHV